MRTDHWGGAQGDATFEHRNRVSGQVASRAAAAPVVGVRAAVDVTRRIDTGVCHGNSPTVQGHRLVPSGSVEASDEGPFGGKAGSDAFTALRWVAVQTTPRQHPF